PLGCAMWLAHYTFHLFSSAGAIVPVSQRLAADLGCACLGSPEWGCACCAAVADGLLRLEILLLDLGFLASLYVGYRTAQSGCERTPQALKAFAPWAVLVLLLFVTGVWTLLQPMEM